MATSTVPPALARRLVAPAPAIVRLALADLASSTDSPTDASAALAAVLADPTSSLTAKTLACHALVALTQEHQSPLVRTPILAVLARTVPHWSTASPPAAAAVATAVGLAVHLVRLDTLHDNGRGDGPPAAAIECLLALLDQAPGLAPVVWDQLSAETAAAMDASYDRPNNQNQTALALVEAALPVLAVLVCRPNIAAGASGPARFPVPILQIADLCLDLMTAASPRSASATAIQSALLGWSANLIPTATPLEFDPARAQWLPHLISASLLRSTGNDDSTWFSSLLITDLAHATHARWLGMDPSPAARAALAVVARVPHAVDAADPTVVVPAISYLLLDVTALDDRLVLQLVRLAATIATGSSSPRAAVAMLMLPALQLSSHPNGDVRAGATELLAVATDAVAHLSDEDCHNSTSPEAATTVTGILADLVACATQSLPLAVNLPHRILSFAFTHLSSSSPSNNTRDELDTSLVSTHAHHLFLLTVHSLASNLRPTYAISVLVPALIGTHNPMLVAKLSALLSGWVKDHTMRPALAASAIAALFAGWKEWPRTYPTVRDAVKTYLGSETFRRNTKASTRGGRSVKKDVEDAHADLERVLVRLIRGAVESTTGGFARHGGAGASDDAALYIAKLVQLPGLHLSSMRDLVLACTAGAHKGLFDGAAAWETLVHPLLRRAVPTGTFPSADDSGAIGVYAAAVAHLSVISAASLRDRIIEESCYPVLPFGMVVDHIDVVEDPGTGSTTDVLVYKPKTTAVAPAAVAAAATRAVLSLPWSTDARRWIPDRPVDLVATCLKLLATNLGVWAGPVATLLEKAVAFDIADMQRSLFLGRIDASSAATTAVAAEMTEDAAQVNATLARAADKVAALTARAPAILSGSVLVSALPLARSPSTIDSAVRSGAFDAHLMHRLAAIPFFMAASARTLSLTSAPARAAQLAATLRLLVAADTPGTKANAIGALVGHALALHAQRCTEAAQVAEFIYALLVHCYIDNNPQPAGAARAAPSTAFLGWSAADCQALVARDLADVLADEVQAAVALAIAQMAAVAGGGGDTAKSAAVENWLVRVFDADASDWAGFAAGVAIGQSLIHAATQDGKESVLAAALVWHATGDKLAFLPIKKAVGLAIGISDLAANRPASVPPAVLEHARKALVKFGVNPTSVPLRGACAAWILVGSSSEEDRSLVVDTLSSVAMDTVADINIRGHLMIVLARARSLADPSTAAADLVPHHLAGWTAPGTVPAVRINHALALFSAAGYNFTAPLTGSTSSLGAKAAVARVMPMLLDLAGAGAHGTAKFAATNARLAKVCLPVLAATLAAWDTSTGSAAGAAAAAAATAGLAVAEPSDYARLERDVSVIRNVFDAHRLKPSSSPTSTTVVGAAAQATLVRALASLTSPMPLVDWVPVLDAVRNAGYASDAWAFAARHAPWSYSAMRYLVQRLVATNKSAQEWELAVSADRGVGVLVDLVGLGNGRNRSTTMTASADAEQRGRKGAQTQISEDRFIDAIHALVAGLWSTALGTTTQGRSLQTTFLDSLASTLPSHAPLVDHSAHVRVTALMTDLYARAPLVSAHARAIGQAAVWTYGAVDALSGKSSTTSSGASGGGGGLGSVPRTIVMAAVLADLIPVRGGATPAISRDRILTIALQASLDIVPEMGRTDYDACVTAHTHLRDSIVRYVRFLGTSTESTVTAAAATADDGNDTALSRAALEWAVRIVDVALLANALTLGGDAVRFVLRFHLLPLVETVATRPTNTVDQLPLRSGIEEDDQGWMAHLTTHLLAVAGHVAVAGGTEQRLVGRLIKRLLAIPPNIAPPPLRAIPRAFRYIENANSEWKAWSIL
ncbi:hypothetical protein BC828DRAFT_406280 [Blastocladiella britannica]|nr:hypothetical protein BC828DRAFT_406280 [Blastocladiella britannica]